MKNLKALILLSVFIFSQNGYSQTSNQTIYPTGSDGDNIQHAINLAIARKQNAICLGEGNFNITRNNTDLSGLVISKGLQAVVKSSDGGFYIMHNDLLHFIESKSEATEWPYSFSTTNWGAGKGFQAMAPASDGGVFIMQNDVLHHINRGDSDTVWPYSRSTTNWGAGKGFQGMAPAFDGGVYIMQNDILHHVVKGEDLKEWPYSRSTTNWGAEKGFQGMATALDGGVFIMQNDILHHVIKGKDLKEWRYSRSTTNWGAEKGFQGMATALDGGVFIMQNDILHHVIKGKDLKKWPYIYSTSNYSDFQLMIYSSNEGVTIMKHDKPYLVKCEEHDTAWSESIDPFLVEWHGNVENLEIFGLGKDKTKIEFTGRRYAIELKAGINNLTIRDLKLSGKINGRNECPEDTCTGIGIHDYGIKNNIKITDLEITKFHNGISLTGSDNLSYLSNFEVKHNHIHEIFSCNASEEEKEIFGGYSTDKSGYGISAVNCNNLSITDNIFENTSRHAIYQRYGQGSNFKMLILRNYIIKHRHNIEPFVMNPERQAAIGIVDTDNIYVAHNTIVGSRSYPISIESQFYDSENIYLIGNQNLGNYSDGLRADTIWVNSQNKKPINNTYLWGNIDLALDNWLIKTKIGDTCDVELLDGVAPWAITQALDEKHSHIYVMKNDKLYFVYPHYDEYFGNVNYQNPKDWFSINTTINWEGFQGMAAAAEGGVYIMQRNLLHHVVPIWDREIWPYTYSSANWEGFQMMVPASDAGAYIMQRNILHYVKAGAHMSPWYIYSTTNWEGFQGMAPSPYGGVYILKDNEINHVQRGVHNTAWSDYIIQ